MFFALKEQLGIEPVIHNTLLKGYYLHACLFKQERKRKEVEKTVSIPKPKGRRHGH
jgi:hypothetical protein